MSRSFTFALVVASARSIGSRFWLLCVFSKLNGTLLWPIRTRNAFFASIPR